MRVKIHTINSIIDFDDIKSVSFDGYTIHQNHCADRWTFPNTQICIRDNNLKIRIIYLYSGVVSINASEINIYAPKAIRDTEEIKINETLTTNNLYKQYISNRSQIFNAKNHMKDFFQKLHK